MLFKTHIPAAPLSEFVHGFWFYEGYVPVHSRERVLPDGTTELVINLNEVSRKLFDDSNSERFQSFRRLWVSGPHSKFIVIDALARSSMIGVHFKPGGLAPFLAIPISELNNQVVELDSILGQAALELRDALLEAASPKAKFGILEAFLMDRLIPKDNAVTVYALRQIMQSPSALRVREIAQALGVSQKHFISRFRAQVGLSPKRFCRIRRFQAILDTIAREALVDWADVACACGYYDQAHFIHDFRAFSGFSPSEYMSSRREYPNHVPLDG